MSVSFRPAADIVWSVEMRGITLFSRQRTIHQSIPYPHAALWALMVAGRFTPDRARDLMALLMKVDPGAAEEAVHRTLTAWREEGLIDAE